jgi:hypothetical protein
MRTKKEYIQAIYDIVPSRMTKKQITAVLDTQALVVSNVLATGSAVDRIVTIPGVAKLRSVVGLITKGLDLRSSLARLSPVSMDCLARSSDDSGGGRRPSQKDSMSSSSAITWIGTPLVVIVSRDDY